MHVFKILLFWPGPATHYQSKVSEQVRQVRRRQQKRSRKFFLLSFSDSFECVIRNLLRNTRNWPSLASGWNMPTNNIDFRQADWEFWWNSSCGMNFFMRLLIEYSCREMFNVLRFSFPNVLSTPLFIIIFRLFRDDSEKNVVSAMWLFLSTHEADAGSSRFQSWGGGMRI